jgi:hypothetical protein
MKRLAVLISLVALFSLAFAAPAAAAAPSNDTYAARVVIGSLPFSDTRDTTDATTDADDAEANTNCGAPATDASVWYELAGTDSTILVDASASDYSAGVIVVSGSPGSFVIESCGPGAVGFFAASGQTYAILAFDDQGDGSGNGGTLNISIDVAPPPPVVDVTVNPTGKFNKVTGSATIGGTVTCTGAADFTYIEVQLTQTVGRFKVSGYGFVENAFVCDGTSQPWSVEVFGSGGLFKGGRAASVTIAVAYSAFSSGYDIEERSIMLRG